MTNGDKFYLTFGFPFNDFNNDYSNWLNEEYTPPHNNLKLFHCNKCKKDYVAKISHSEKDEFGVDTYFSKCPICDNENEVYYWAWR